MIERHLFTNADAIPRAELTSAHAVNTRLDGSTLARLPSSKTRRLKNALGDALITYPVGKSSYRVITLKDDGTRSDYVVSVFNQPWCECGDFIYSCLPESQSQTWCKHIFRVWSEIRVGALPPIGIDPAFWLRAKLKDEYLRYYDGDPDTAQRIKTYHDRLEPGKYDSVLFRRATMLYREVNKHSNTM